VASSQADVSAVVAEFEAEIDALDETGVRQRLERQLSEGLPIAVAAQAR
jgi:hypothetical protein